jgi:hypothetical protein
MTHRICLACMRPEWRCTDCAHTDCPFAPTDPTQISLDSRNVEPLEQPDLHFSGNKND